MRRRTGVIAVVGATLAVDSLFYTAIIPILGRLARRFALSPSQSGIVVGAYAMAMVFAAYPSGRVVVRWRGRISLIAGLTTMAIGCLIFALASSAMMLVVARVVQGIGGTLSWTGGLAWLAEMTPDHRRGRVLGTALGLGVVGSQLGPLVGAAAATLGRAPTFALGTVAGLGLAGLASRLPSADDGRPGLTRRPGLIAARKFRVGLWLTALPSACLGLLDVLGPLRLSAMGETPLVIGADFFAAAGLLALASRLTGQAIDRSGTRGPIRLALFGSLAVMVLLAVGASAGVLMASIILGSALLGSLWGPGMHLLAGAARRHGVEEGFAFAAFLFAWAVGFAVGSTSSGLLAHAGGDALAYGLGAGLCLLTVLLGVRVTTRHVTITTTSEGL